MSWLQSDGSFSLLVAVIVSVKQLRNMHKTLFSTNKNAGGHGGASVFGVGMQGSPPVH